MRLRRDGREKVRAHVPPYLYIVALSRARRRGPPKGFKLKRKRSIGDDPSDVPTRRNDDTEPRDRPTQHEDPPIDSSSHSAQGSPPISTASQWSAMRTSVSREPIPARRIDHDVRATAGITEPSAANDDDDDGNDATDDVGFAVSALESLAEERFYPTRRATSVSPERRAEIQIQQETAGPLSPPPCDAPTTLRPPESAVRPLVHSVPTSSRNSEDGIAEARPEGVGKRVHVDRQTQDRLLAIYWTHIHVRPSFLFAQEHRLSVRLSPPRTSGRCSTSPSFTPRRYTSRCYSPCLPPHPPSPRPAKRSSTQPRPNNYSIKPKTPSSSDMPRRHPARPRPPPHRATTFTRFPRRNRACRRYSV